MKRRFTFDILRNEAGDGTAGGGASEPAWINALPADAQAEARAAVRKAAEADQAKADKAKAERKAAEANGELAKLLEIERNEKAAAIAAAEAATKVSEGLIKRDRSTALLGAVAAKLGVPVSPVLIGLLPQTGEDVAPEKITDALVGKVADAVRKLAPDLKPARQGAPGPMGGDLNSDPSSNDYWVQRGKQASGR